MSETHLLPGAEIAISISDAPDLGKLGYPRREVDRALLSICGALVRAGACVSYGGNVDAAGYTFKIFEYLARTYTTRGAKPPFIHYLPESVLRTADFDNLNRLAHVGSGIVETRVLVGGRVAGTLLPLGADFGIRMLPGREFLPFGNAQSLALWMQGQARQPDDVALTFMRELVSERCTARIVLGGKMGILDKPLDRYSGAMPGIVEETLTTLKHGKPLIPLGAFGGAGRDVAIALGLLPEQSRVPRGPQAASYGEALERVSQFRERLPPGLRSDLSTLATLDRTEVLAQHTLSFLSRAIH